MLIAIGTFFNAIIRNLVGQWTRRRQKRGMTEEAIQKVVGVPLQELKDQKYHGQEVKGKLDEVKAQLESVEGQLQKRERQLTEALEVADQLEQQVLLSIETVKLKDQELTEASEVAEELAQAQDTIQTLEKSVQSLRDDLHNTKTSAESKLQTEKQAFIQQKSELLAKQEETRHDFEQQIQKLNEQLSQTQLQSQNVQINFEQLEEENSKLTQRLIELGEANKRNENEDLVQNLYKQIEQLEQTKQDQSKLSSQIHKYEEEISNLRIQVQKSEEQLLDYWQQDSEKWNSIQQENKDREEESQRMISSLQAQIVEARKEGQLSQIRLDRFQKWIKESLVIIVDGDRASELDENLQKMKEEVLSPDSSLEDELQGVLKEELKDIFQTSIESIVKQKTLVFQQTIQKLDEKRKLLQKQYLEDVQEYQRGMKDQQKLLQQILIKQKTSQSQETYVSQDSAMEQNGQVVSQPLPKIEVDSQSEVQEEFQEEQPNERSTVKTKIRTKVISAGVSLAHPDKIAKGGDDAFFADGPRLAVADGVGGWENDGIDPSIYSSTLMQNYGMEISKQDPRSALQKAQDETLVKGSCTACGAKIGGDLMLQVINVGDTGCRVFRNGKCVFKTNTQMHQFNMPYQLAWLEFLPQASRAAQGDFQQVRCQKGDVILLGSDGYFDNVWDRETGIMLNEFLGGQNGDVSQQDRLNELSLRLCKQAQRNAVDNNYSSPFMVDAVQAGVVPWTSKFFRKGGKLDDCTVVIAQIL